jgi:hypothetical protein
LELFILRTKFFLFSRAEEVKEHPYFKDMDWKQVYLLKLTPPLIPPRGEVNAADAFDIGNFDEDDTKGIKVRTSLRKMKLIYIISLANGIGSRIIQKFSNCYIRTMATGNNW